MTGCRRDGAFDSFSTAFPSVFQEGGEIFLYYTGSPNKLWSLASIGVAWSKNGLDFARGENAILTDQTLSAFAWESVTPAVCRVKSKYFMILAGRKRRHNRRVLGIAYSDDPKGPFVFIKIIRKPLEPWEGFSIDNGTTLIKEKEDTIILYYSNCASSLSDIILRRPFRRSIGILKIRINGKTPRSIEVLADGRNPLLGLRGCLGDWNESVFCPGYLQCENFGVLFFAASKYSSKSIPQSIGYVFVDSPTIGRILYKPQWLINQSSFVSVGASVLAFDSPSPVLAEDGKMLVFYSVMDRNTGDWKIMRNTLEFKG